MVGDLVLDEECKISFCEEDSVINAGEFGGGFSGRIDIFIARDAPMTRDLDERNEELVG